MGGPNQSLVIYIVKCVIGTLAVFAISSLIHYKNLGWALISVILVLSPEGDDTVNIAINRIKANVIGAGVGLFCLLTGYSNMWTMCLAVTITLVVSHYFNLDTSTRSALAATVIIMLHQEGTHLWSTAIERVIAVFAGGALGFVITFVFHLFYKPAPKTAETILPKEQSPF